jgi:hypothetical protein
MRHATRLEDEVIRFGNRNLAVESAGGTWSSGTAGDEIVLDATDFCRLIAGRPGPDGAEPSGLLTTQVPF